ncbi:MAG: adenosine deaminase [Frankia sp.]
MDEPAIRRIPRAEVHVHLEGCFELADVAELARAAGEPLPRPVAAALDADGPGGLAALLRMLDWQCGLVRTAEQAARAAYRFAARETSSGVAYADLIVNPTHWTAWTGRVPALFEAFAAGLDEAEQDGLAAVGLCPSLLRQQTAAQAADLVDWMVTTRPRRVVALSIDGDERSAGRVSGRFAEAFARAGRAGFGRTVHAGESSGPEGVWDAITVLGADRIDHGIRCVDDPELVTRLAGQQVPLGVCPLSNIVLGVASDRRSHPLERLRRAGVPVSVNTDDPAVLRYRNEQEWALCAEAYDWGLDVVVELARTSVVASFADVDRKQALLAELDTCAEQDGGAERDAGAAAYAGPAAGPSAAPRAASVAPSAAR